MGTDSTPGVFTVFGGMSALSGQPIELQVAKNDDTRQVREDLTTRERPQGEMTAEQLEVRANRWRNMVAGIG